MHETKSTISVRRSINKLDPKTRHCPDLVVITIVAGSRSMPDSLYPYLADCLDTLLITKIVSGHASQGADKLGEWYGWERDIEVILMPADWDRYGRAAGHRRNAEMAGVAEALAAFWDGVSPGTRGMIDIAKKRGLQVQVFKVT